MDKVTAALHEFVRDRGLPQHLLSELPNKIEWVCVLLALALNCFDVVAIPDCVQIADVAVLPQGCLSSPEWTRSSDTDVWLLIAAAAGASRLSQRARIDPGNAFVLSTAAVVAVYAKGCASQV